MAEDDDQTMRKEPIVKWFYAVIGLIPLAIGGLFIVLEYFLLSPETVNVFGSDVGRNAPQRWMIFVILLLVGLFFARVGIVMILHFGEQIRNQKVFKRGVIKIQAAILNRWRESDNDTLYIKFSYHVTGAVVEANPIEVVVEVDYGLYKKLANENYVRIQYAIEDPLIVALEGEL